MVKTPRFHRRGRGFDPCGGNKIPHGMAKKKGLIFPHSLNSGFAEESGKENGDAGKENEVEVNHTFLLQSVMLIFIGFIYVSYGSQVHFLGLNHQPEE